MHFLFNLVITKGLYKFRALLAHLQEALNKRHLVYGGGDISWRHREWLNVLKYLASYGKRNLLVLSEPLK
jgi:predicted NBD/HSP70 family sugar kinase